MRSLLAAAVIAAVALAPARAFEPAKHPVKDMPLSSSAALADLRQFEHAMRSAGTITFSATVADLHGSAPLNYDVSGVFSHPGSLRFTASQAGKQLVAYASVGTAYAAYSEHSARYVRGVKRANQPLAFDGTVSTFLSAELGRSAMPDLLTPVVIATNSNIELLAVPQPVPGITQRYSVSERQSVLDGQPVIVSTLALTLTSAQGPSESAGEIVTYTRNPWQLKRIEVCSGPSPARLKTLVRTDFHTFQLSEKRFPAAASQLALLVPRGAKRFDPAADPPQDEPSSPTLQPGADAPDFTVNTASGKPVKLSDYRGRVVVLDLWATWCGPCQMSLPHTDKIAAAYQPRGVVFLPVCVWDDKSSYAAWLTKHKRMLMTFLFDPTGRSGTSFSQALYKVDGIPTQFVIGKDGKIVSTIVGYNPTGDPEESELKKAIDKALASS